MDELDLLNGAAADIDNDLETLQPTARQVDPAAAAGEVAIDDAMTPEIARQEADLVVNMIADGVQMAWPILSYGPETRSKGVTVLAPLLEKYSGGSSFLTKFGPEIMAISFFGTITYQSIRAVKDAEAKKKTQIADSSPRIVIPGQEQPTQAAAPGSGSMYDGMKI